CHDNPIINKCFGAIADYTELLLPVNILSDGGFIDMVNETEFITEEQYASAELIGWLYQFYISDRKDEAFAKKGKYDPDEIAPATQIFTPNWIVKYMVQNTIGRIYLDNNPSAASEFKSKWQYLVEPSEPTPKDSVFRFKELTELLTGDLACGSGHILNECFDLLYDLYIYEGYSRKEAIENIFNCNLRGVDLDTRAKQLATFALMLKACQKDASFADAHILPHVLSMPTPIPQEQVTDRLQQFFRETPSRQQLTDLTAAFELMQDAESLGSIMKFDVAESTLLSIQQTLNYWQHEQFVPEEVEDILPAMDLILTLTDKYAALVMNPPYMGSGNMNETLYSYIKKHYEEGKADLYSTFMLLAIDRLANNAKYGMINMHTWMFLSSFERLRKTLINKYRIDSLLHLGTRTFDELGGEVVQNTAFVISKIDELKGSSISGTYFRLVDGKNCGDKECMFLKAQANHNTKVYYASVEQNNYEKIPGSPIGYWVSDKQVKLFDDCDSLASILTTREGMAPADNKLFLRLWFEISSDRFSWFNKASDKWYPYIKGGTYRKWSGNYEYVVDWANDGYAIKNNVDPSTGRIRSHNYNGEYAFQESISWTVISFGKVALRYTMKGFLWDSAGASGFSQKHLKFNLGLINSVVAKSFLKILSPSTKLNVGEVINIPLIEQNVDEIESIVNNNINISKLDWDSHETSWDFEANPLVALRNEKVAQGNLESSFRLSDFVEEFETQWTERFMQLHQNEEELNRQFISIYGLEDELTPDVPLDEITILQQGEISIVNNGLEWHEDVLMKQLISYAVGVWMGRYKLGQKGLHIAHPNPTDKEMQEYWYGGVQVYIDEDGLIPVLPQSSPFDDNLSSRISDFIRITFGEDKLTENLNYIEQKLGTSIDQYVQKDFWKDHKKMYQNRPIYWLFSSSKGAFKCLAYMHRMNAYTAERVRSNYLLPYIEFLQNQIGEMENRRATLSTAENRKLQNFQKALDECREYHERLQVVAEQAITFDLDDGVVVNYAKFGDVLAKIK
nr:BREX-1 system adenine-specific DNA-methyltransferase PglX [Bacteroidaceae bacterium]